MLPGVETEIRYTSVPGVVIRRFSDRVAKRVIRVYSGIGSGIRYGVHNNSLNNLLRGAAERVLYKPSASGLVKPPRPEPTFFTESLRAVRGMLVRHTTPTPKVSLEEFPLLFTGRKRMRYEMACANLASRGLKRTDAHVKGFLKAEKVNFTAKGDPAPRFIQPRADEFLAATGQYLKKFEKALFRAFERAFGYKVVLKGLNAIQQAGVLRRHWRRYANPVCFGLDASRFDQHVSPEALRFEHSVYNDTFKDPELARILEMQIHNKVTAVAADGLIRYKLFGGRMSGDSNTGMGNCILMSLVVLGYIKEHGIDARLGNNGDDCVIICESHDLDKFEGLSEWCLRGGFCVVREEPVCTFEKIEFCQCHPVLASDGLYRMTRNPWTAPSKDAVSLLSWANQEEFDAWAAAIGGCGLALTKGVPFWESFYRNLLGERRRQDWADAAVRDSGLGYMVGDMQLEDMPITEEARYSFYLAFGMLPDEQVALECAHAPVAYREPRPMTFAEVEHLQSPLSLCRANRPNLS